MCNQCNCNQRNCNSCGCSLLRGLQNLFQCGGNCGCGGNGNGNGRDGNGNCGCGCNSCGCSNARSFVNGFNLANTLNSCNSCNTCNSCNSCGGHNTHFFSNYGVNTYSTGGNTLFSNGTNLSCFTQCGRNIDPYYAQQYGLCVTCGCSCGCGN